MLIQATHLLYMHTRCTHTDQPEHPTHIINKAQHAHKSAPRTSCNAAQVPVAASADLNLQASQLLAVLQTTTVGCCLDRTCT